MVRASIGRRWATVWPFALLCLGAASVWLLPENFPQIHFDLRSGAVGCTIAAVVSLLFVRNARKSIKQPLLVASIGGALAILGPSVGSFLNATGLSAGALTISLALTPVVVAVAAPACGSERLPEDRLWPGMFAAAALLLAITMPSLDDVRSDAAMLMAPLLTGVGCVLYKRIEAHAILKAVGSFVLAATIFAAGSMGYALQQHGGDPVSFAAAGMEAALFLLALLALQRLSSMQYAARYALVPLLLLLEGPALLAPTLMNYHNLLCGAMLLVATIVLLRSKAEENVPEQSLGDTVIQR